MNAIIHPQKQVLDYLGGPQKKQEGKKYRLCKLLVFDEYDGVKLIYNGLTQSMASVNEAEYQAFLNMEVEKDFVDFMFRNYFMVEEDVNEAELIFKYRKEHEIPFDENYLKNPTSFTILTTTSCNARCFYCYEKGVKKKTMTPETAEKIAKYIIDKYPKDSNKTVSIGWFGGEPTVNTKVMDVICGKLKEAGIKFSSHFTTNAYLMDEEMCKRAVNDWNVNNAQVTIDGTERIYNRAKNYVYDQEKEGSPFERIISNLNTMIKFGIGISIRMNMDMYNYEDIDKLVDILKERVNDPKKRMSAYCYPLFDGYGVSRGFDAEFALFEKVDLITKKIEKVGLAGNGGVRGRSIQVHHCMVDGGNEVLFSPDGHMGLCEHYTESEFFGHIDDPDNIDWDVVKSFKEQITDYDICRDCGKLPDCIKLKMCEDLRDCDEAKKMWQQNRLRSEMRTEYKKFVKNTEGRKFGLSGQGGSNLVAELDSLKESIAELSARIDKLEKKG